MSERFHSYLITALVAIIAVIAASYIPVVKSSFNFANKS